LDESGRIFEILMLLFVIGIFWNIYLEYSKLTNGIKELREEVKKLKKERE